MIVLPERPQQVVDLVKEFIILEVGDSRSNIGIFCKVTFISLNDT